MAKRIGVISEVRKFLGEFSCISLKQPDIEFLHWIGCYGGLSAVRPKKFCHVHILVFDGSNSRERCAEVGKMLVCCLQGQTGMLKKAFFCITRDNADIRSGGVSLWDNTINLGIFAAYLTLLGVVSVCPVVVQI